MSYGKWFLLQVIDDFLEGLQQRLDNADRCRKIFIQCLIFLFIFVAVCLHVDVSRIVELVLYVRFYM